MELLLAHFQAHGVLTLSVALFAKRMGVPVPALPFLLLAGAQGAGDGIFALMAWVGGSFASILADLFWFVAGRRYGRSVLALTCRISMAPGSCIRKSELVFARHGAFAVLFAKFIPGVAGLAPPLAGALGMRSALFLLLNNVGTVLWVGSGIAAGLLFQRQVDSLLRSLERMGSAALPLLGLLLVLYLGWIALRRLLIAIDAGKAPRIQPQRVADMIARGDKVLLVDVRGAGVLPDARLPGALHASVDTDEFDRLADLAGDAQVVMYCDCPADVSAGLAALALTRRGAPAQVLAGGFSAWVAAGLPVQKLAGFASSPAGPGLGRGNAAIDDAGRS